jgi:hypothetical protein
MKNDNSNRNYSVFFMSRNLLRIFYTLPDIIPSQEFTFSNNTSGDHTHQRNMDIIKQAEIELFLAS